jgi:uncharacterized protein (TIGR00725 family)
MAEKRFIAVIGAGDASADVRALALAVGREIAARSAVLVCGGLGGVMEAAAQGAREAGGHTIGILPSYNRESANRYIEFAIPTGMGEARNAIVIGSADAAVALPGGEGGTLAEIGFALKLKRPVVALNAWKEIAGVSHADNPADAVALALKLAAKTK